MGKELYRENKKILYQRHDYDPQLQTKNVHHIIFRSDGGTDKLENLSLLPIELHQWIHSFVEKIHI
jgi:hypothetical protein